MRAVLRALTTSDGGARHVDRMAPLPNQEDAATEIRRVGLLKLLTEQGHGLPAMEVGPLGPVLRRLRTPGAVLPGAELLTLLPLLRSTRLAAEALHGARDTAPELAALGERLTPLPHLERALDETFDPGTGEMRDSASPALKRIRREREQLRERLRSRMERMASRLTTSDGATLVTLREGRFVLSVPQSQRGQVDGLVQDRSGSGATVYLEPMEAVPENNGLRESDAEEREEIRRILAALTARFAADAGSLADDLESLAYLDFLRARAHLGVRWSAEPPRFGDRLDLRGARHPLLLEARGVESDPAAARAAVIPLTVALDGATRLLLVTGPNMGGKTVALKMVGLAVALAQCGCLVPADPGMILPWTRHLVVSLGDEQSLEADLSTFGAHLARWGDALRLAGDGTLVLLDELGSGTDPTEGAALAQSVLERLTETGTLGLVTTHLGVLKGFGAEREGMENASMVFDSQTREPTYRMAVGVPGESHALDMARRLGFPEERVERAVALLPEAERDVRRLLQDLDRERQRLSQARETAERTRREADQFKVEHETRLRRLLDERATLRARAARQAREILRRAEDRLKEIERATRQGARPGIDRRSLQREQVALGRLETPRRPAAAPGTVPERIVVGESYWAESLGRSVEVVREPDASGRVLVQQEGLRIELPRTALRVVGSEPPRNGRTVPGRAAAAQETVPNTDTVTREVRLIGMRVDEAMTELESAIDRALLAGLGELRVVHGKGTGALRAAVGELARGHGAVSASRTADPWEGGAGATILELER